MGWAGAAKPRKATEGNDRKLSESPDLVIGSDRGATQYEVRGVHRPRAHFGGMAAPHALSFCAQVGQSV